ncbi:xanthine dehydrogenase family protein molybdopterin-binding subunit [Paenibacillus sp. FSL H8-0537]|uniref:xanthine dehydrogenase family protein molybdopterin-binding subunit n=1 Tax=Paenibacillus sp. FSL H8-0537 TaxID=2921399 RepID=UPI003100B1CC
MRETSSKLRKEDYRLLRGEGRFVADLFFPNTHYVGFIRSKMPHARLLLVDIEAALHSEGVVAIIKAEDLPAELGEVPMIWPLEGLRNPGHPLLAKDTVRYKGEPFAVVVATSPEALNQAMALVNVVYDPLPSITSLSQVIGSSVPPIHEEAEGHKAYCWMKEYGDRSALDRADDRLEQRLVVPRVVPSPIETRGIVASYDPVLDELKVWSSTQFAHVLRLSLALTLPHPENRLQVQCPDVGGAFGAKMNVYREEILVAYLSKRLKKVLKYIETRSEHFLATTHGRDQIQEVTAHYRHSGEIEGLEVRIHANMGAYLQAATPGIPIFTTQMLSGCYHIPYIRVEVIGYYTNQTPTDAYRGAGRPEASYLVERTIDLVAQRLHQDSADIRIQNFIQPEEFPKKVVTGLVYDSGNYAEALKQAIELVGMNHWKEEQHIRRQRGDVKQIGIGISSYVEFCGSGPSRHNAALGLMTGGFESAVVRILPTGKAVVISGTCPSGQGHHTSWSMLTERLLGIPLQDVEVVTGNTVNTPWGSGTFGSRSAAVGGAAIYRACEKIIKKVIEYVGFLWNKPVSSLVFEQGIVKAGAQEIGIVQVAHQLYLAHQLPPDMEPGLEATAFFEPDNYTFPFGCHICIAEVDTSTGQPKILQYAAVDDCGETIHEQIVEGQVRGGIVQGMGQALWEAFVSPNDQGLMETDSFRTYRMPRATDIPPILLGRTCTPSPVNPLGVKGVGESGAIGSPPAIMNAIVDALKLYGVEHLDMPATPNRIWQIIKAKRGTIG